MAESFRSTPASLPQPSAGASGGVWNEMTDFSGQIRPHWQQLGPKINRWTTDERSSLASSAERMIEDLGTTFNVFSDVGGAGQPYELDSIPLVIPPGGLGEGFSRISAADPVAGCGAGGCLRPAGAVARRA